MKKSTFLKVALVAVAMFMFAGANAQYPPAIATDYVQVADSTYQTVGKAFRLYVAPDNVYSPGYEASPIAANINTNSRWTWTYTGLTGAPVSGVVSAANDNFVTFTTIPLGSHSVSVVESNSVSGCADGSAVVHGVRVIAAPTAVVAGSTGNVDYTWTTLVANSFRACAPAIDGTETVTVTITESPFLPEAFRSYAFGVSGVVENVEADLTTPVAPSLSTPSFEYTVAAKLKASTVAAAHTWTPNGVGTATSTLSFATPALAVLNNLPTRYTFTLVKASDLANPQVGIVSGVSHKSDIYTGTVLGNAFGAATTVTYLVLPAPVTGPIYHIPSNFVY